MSEQKTLFTNEQLLSLLEDWSHDMGINEPSAVHAEIVRTMNELRRAIDQATVEQLMPTILEGLPNLNGGDYPYSLPDDLEDAFGINQWDDRTWGEMIHETGYIEYPIHAPMSDAFRALGKDGEWNAKNLAFAKLFPLERLDEIRQWAKKVYGWDCDIDVSLECCNELTYDGLGDEEVISAWGYLYVGPYVGPHVPEPVEFGPSNVDVHQPVADCPVESIMDQIDHLSPEQLDMLLERIHADYGVEHETSTSMIIDHPA